MVDIEKICALAKKESYDLATLSAEKKNEILFAIADEIENSKERILKENAKDIEAATALSESMKDRLRLNDARIAAICEGVRDVAKLDDPVGEITETWTRPNGLEISKVRVPLGVIGVIYESRPNVTADVAALCIKSGNCVVLRGGKEAINSNRILASIISDAIEKSGVISRDIVAFVDDVTRDGSLSMLKQSKYIDVVIPRGGDGLKKFVLENAMMPVIASAGGNCHLYVEKTADLDMAAAVVANAKLSRPSTCNALEQLLVDRSVAREFLPLVCGILKENGCVVNGSEEARSYCDYIQPCEEDEYYKEHGDKVLTVYIVDGVVEAVERVNSHSTCHSDGILTKDKKAADYFAAKVDSACVYVNASTRFTDGFEFGFGAEIGISTQKLHARGPLGLKQLTSEKYVVRGNGQVRK